MSKVRIQNGGKIMEKFRVELELNFKPKLDSKDSETYNTKSYRNAIGRIQVWEAIELALHRADLSADVYLVRKVNS
jgi:hypothetical protein